MTPVWKTAGCLAMLALMSSAHAALVSFDLDQSNTLPDGPAYLRVTIDDQGVPGWINFSIAVLDPLLEIADGNFGIQKFGFNSAFQVASSNITGLPANWRYDGKGNMSAFGYFDAHVAAERGNARVTDLSFSVTGLSMASLASYLEPSSGKAGQGNYFFAAHVAGFEAQDPGSATSAFFAGSTPSAVTVVPLPASVWLLLGGLGLLGIPSLRRGRKPFRTDYPAASLVHRGFTLAA